MQLHFPSFHGIFRRGDVAMHSCCLLVGVAVLVVSACASDPPAQAPIAAVTPPAAAVVVEKPAPPPEAVNVEKPSPAPKVVKPPNPKAPS